MDRWRGRVALVTGASAGIGAAICKLLSRNGMKVVGCARRVEKIDKLSEEHPNIRGYKCDLRNESEIEKMFEWIGAEPDLGRVDVCVANAGLSSPESLLDGKVSDWRRMLDVNVIALCLCTQLAVKSMRKNEIDDGQIVFINSMSGHRVPPNPSTRFYSATKYAVTALIEGWRQELCDVGGSIRVSSVSPGLVRTEFATAMLGSQEKAEAIWASVPECLAAEDMAAHVGHILEMPKHVQIHDILVRPTAQKF